jgi:hypothetical protein
MLNSLTLPIIIKGAQNNNPIKAATMATIQDFGLSLGINGLELITIVFIHLTLQSGVAGTASPALPGYEFEHLVPYGVLSVWLSLFLKASRILEERIFSSSAASSLPRLSNVNEYSSKKSAYPMGSFVSI